MSDKTRRSFLKKLAAAPLAAPAVLKAGEKIEPEIIECYPTDSPLEGLVGQYTATAVPWDWDKDELFPAQMTTIRKKDA